MKTHRLSLIAFCALTFTLAPLCAAQAAVAETGPRITLKPGQTLTGRFDHQHPVEGFDKPLRTQGRFAVSPESKIIWTIEKPMMTTTTITSEGLTQSVGNFQLMKVNAQQVPFLATMQQKLLWAISGNWEKLEPDFIIERRGNQTAWEVTITPKNPDETRKAFRKIVARGGRFVEQANVELPNGTVDLVTFSDSKISP